MFVTCANTDMHTISVGLLYNSCLVISNRESSGFDCVFSNIVFRGKLNEHVGAFRLYR